MAEVKIVFVLALLSVGYSAVVPTGSHSTSTLTSGVGVSQQNSENVIVNEDQMIQGFKMAHLRQCNPSACGPNSQCTVSKEFIYCSCLPGFVGEPPNCKLECVTNSDCSANLTCMHNTCKNSCPEMLELINSEALCHVIDHAHVFTCLPGYTGDPLKSCEIIGAPKNRTLSEDSKYLTIRLESISAKDPCSECGYYSECKIGDYEVTCSCQLVGVPPRCHASCFGDHECASNRACIQNYCHNPCDNACGLYATCAVIDHKPVCSCSPDDPVDQFNICKLCHPTPCGRDAKCSVVRNRTAVCECEGETYGDPYDRCYIFT